MAARHVLPAATLILSLPAPIQASSILERVLQQLESHAPITSIAANTADNAAGIWIDGGISILAGRLPRLVSEVSAVPPVDVGFGELLTTVLGATNTGSVFTDFSVDVALGAGDDAGPGGSVGTTPGTADIVTGVNSTVLLAATQTARAIRRVSGPMGTDTAASVLALNAASNSGDILGAIEIDLQGVNAELAAVSASLALEAHPVLRLENVDDLLGRIESTVLGSVNGGTILSGVAMDVAEAIDRIVPAP